MTSSLAHGRCKQRSGARENGAVERALHASQAGVAENEAQRETIMLRTRLALLIIPLFITATALADPPVSAKSDSADKAGKMSETMSILHAVGQWSIKLSDMADKKAKSELVKDYARTMAMNNTGSDAKLMSIAKKHGIDVAQLNAKTEEGKSLLQRIKGETTLLNSLDGDAFDKEYMTLVTNTQQSAIHFLDKSEAMATDPDVKQFLSDMSRTVQERLKTAQDVMTKIYGDKI
jgi:predicted outer membrane protein